MKTFFISYLTLIGLFVHSNLFASDQGGLSLMTQEMLSYDVEKNDKEITITREMKACGKNRGFLQPLVPVKGVTLVNEIDILLAMNDPKVLIVDLRSSHFYYEETLPLAINVPYTGVSLNLDELGCEEEDSGKWDCKNAITSYVFCNGPACTQSPIGIREMIELGFPVEKIFYYRGGMLVWSALGLTTVKGEL